MYDPRALPLVPLPTGVSGPAEAAVVVMKCSGFALVSLSFLLPLLTCYSNSSAG